jgi:hypothetical protein
MRNQKAGTLIRRSLVSILGVRFGGANINQAINIAR